MIRTIIIEDELKATEVLCSMLHDHFRELEVVAVAHTVPEGIQAIEQYNPDLVLSDVQLGESYAFEIFQTHPPVNFDVIFISGYEQFAIQAIKFAAIDYLLKPFSLKDLKLAVENYTKRQQHKQSVVQFEALFHNLRQVQKGTKKIALPTTSGLEVVSMNDIIRCQAQINYTYIYLTQNQKFVISKTLKEYEDLLHDYDFLRVHNSHLVNLHYIKNYIRGEGGTITMSDGTSIEVSRRKKDELIKKLSGL